MKYEKERVGRNGKQKERGVRIERGLKNGMGGQTRVNLASGGHTLPEETGASRLASPLMALRLLTHIHTCTRAAVLENRYTTGTWV